VILSATPVKGAFLVELDRREDERGFFARTWCQREAAAHGLNPRVVQCSVSVSLLAGTVRGMHYQAAPHEEARLVRCTRGAIYDVIIDLRPDSPSYFQHWATTLTADNRRALYVPEGVAHGFQTLEDQTEVFYQMSAFYAPDAARGVRWDNAAFGIRWPLPVSCVSERDRAFPDFVPPPEPPR
jgi:dTDP-4-dehydrorhamnose 3,5-epimerase